MSQSLTSIRPAAWLRGLLLLALSLGATSPAWADDCGAEGMRACTIGERIPSCDLNLVEGGGVCTHPLCGREGQVGCNVIQRTFFDLILKVPLPLPCDWNLKFDNFANRCSHPDCGRDGQKACDVLTRLPSCDTNLVEDRGVCVHPACGRENERLCEVWRRGPLHICDADLVDRGGTCQRPGAAPVSAPPPPTSSTSSSQGALTSGSTGSGSAPPPPKKRGAVFLPAAPPVATYTPPPAPAPAPTPAPAVTMQPRVAMPLLSASRMKPAVAAPPAPALEVDTDRPGSDYAGFDQNPPDPAACAARCAQDGQCRAWTFVKPGIQGPAARCYVKNVAPAPVSNTCCVSGAK